MAGEKYEPAKRSPKGSAAHYVKTLLRWFNYIVIAGSAGSITCMLLLRLSPSPWGWGFIIFSCLSFFSGLVGCISMVAHASCYSLQMFLIVTSATLQGIVSLTLFSKPELVLGHLQSSRSDFDAKILLKLDAAMLMGVFCTQLMVLVLACVVHHCEPMDYTDLEGNSVVMRGRRNLARVQEETLGEDGRSGKEESEAGRLNREMKAKYSQQRVKEEEEDENLEL